MSDQERCLSSQAPICPDPSCMSEILKDVRNLKRSTRVSLMEVPPSPRVH